MAGAHRILIEGYFTRSPRFVPSAGNLMLGSSGMRPDLWEWNCHNFSQDPDEFGVWNVTFCEWFDLRKVERNFKFGCRFRGVGLGCRWKVNIQTSKELRAEHDEG